MFSALGQFLSVRLLGQGIFCSILHGDLLILLLYSHLESTHILLAHRIA
jgi:hypothetical protein